MIRFLLLAITLSWVDNSANETGFSIERRDDGARDFVEIGRTGRNVARFTDDRTSVGVAYEYRVRAFNSTGFSRYSETVRATALEQVKRDQVPAAFKRGYSL